MGQKEALNMSDAKYYNTALWKHPDKQITTNMLSLTSVFSKDAYGISPTRIQFSLNNYKSGIFNQLSFSHVEVYKLLNETTKRTNKIKDIYKRIQEDSNYSEGFKIATPKKNLHLHFVHRIEYGGPCVRLAISTKEDSFDDSERFYMDLFAYLSLEKILYGVRDNYIGLSTTSTIVAYLESVKETTDNLRDRLTNFCLEVEESKLRGQAIAPPSNTTIHEQKTELDSPEIEALSDDIDFSVQKDVVDFVNENKKDMVLPVTSDELAGYDVEINKQVIPKRFTSEFLKNDVKNLEMFVLNSVNEKLPIMKFSESVCKSLGMTSPECLFSGCDSKDINAVSYFTTLLLKHCIGKHLSQKAALPLSTSPILFKPGAVSDEIYDIVFDLYLYFVYYTKVRDQLREKDSNTTNNKELISFCLKTILSPLVFSYIESMDKNVLISTVVSRYEEYQKAGVFEKLENECQNTYKFIPTVSATIIEEEISRSYDILKANLNKYNPPSVFKSFEGSGFLTLKYEDFQNHSMDSEQIIKLIILEFDYCKYKKVDFDRIEEKYKIKDFSDIPKEILENYKLKESKFDTTNLTRFLSDNCKDDKQLPVYLDLAKKMNSSIVDIIDVKVDYTYFSEPALKAFVLWDVDTSPKITNNYMHYLKIIDETSLDKSMLISLIANPSKEESDFMNCYLAGAKS